MIGLEALCARFARLEAATLRHWVECGWVRPQRDGEALAFDEADVARVALLCDLRFEIQLEEDSLPVVLALLDQLYDLRRQLAGLRRALGMLPPQLRADLEAAVARGRERSEDGGR